METHSFCKGSATYASRFGLPRDWVNLRGCWRGKKKQLDTYIDVDQPYPDAHIAAVLYGPRGHCKYAVKAGIVVPAAFLDSDISPLINLGTQHDGRSAWTWMKRVLTTFVSLWEGKKDLLESTKMDFYET